MLTLGCWGILRISIWPIYSFAKLCGQLRIYNWMMGFKLTSQLCVAICFHDWPTSPLTQSKVQGLSRSETFAVWGANSGIWPPLSLFADKNTAGLTWKMVVLYMKYIFSRKLRFLLEIHQTWATDLRSSSWSWFSKAFLHTWDKKPFCISACQSAFVLPVTSLCYLN